MKENNVTGENIDGYIRARVRAYPHTSTQAHKRKHRNTNVAIAMIERASNIEMNVRRTET